MSDSVKTPQEVEEMDFLNDSTTISFGDKKEIEAAGGGFAPLEENIYLMEVSNSEVKERPNYEDKTVMEKVLMLSFDIIKTKSGDPIVDASGEKQKDGVRKYWEWLSVSATGFRGDGKPSKTRECLCALMGLSVDDGLPAASPDDFVGKQAYVMLELAHKKDGTLKNKAIKYSKV